MAEILSNSLSDAYAHQIFRYVNNSIEEEEGFHFLGFEFLQRLNLTHIQTELMTLKDEIFEHQKTSENAQKRLKALLVDYGERRCSEQGACC